METEHMRSPLAQDPSVAESLAQTRGLISVTAMASGLVGLLPFPPVGEAGLRLLRGALLCRLASRREVELSRALAELIADQPTPQLLWRAAAQTACEQGRHGAWGRLGRALLWMSHFEEMGRTFLLGTYFDYYVLAHLGPDPRITERQAIALQQAIRVAGSTAKQHLVAALFQKALADVVRAGTFLPRTLWGLLSSALDGDRAAPSERVIVDVDARGLLGKLVEQVEDELGATGRLTLQALCTAFDEAWAARGTDPRMAAGSGPGPFHAN